MAEDRKPLIDEIKQMIENYSEADVTADAADENLAKASSDLDNAHGQAQMLNADAEQQLFLDEQAASSAYDIALANAKNKRDEVKQRAFEMVNSAQLAEQNAQAVRDDAREEVKQAFEAIKEKLLSLAAA
jgi:predicted ATPase